MHCTVGALRTLPDNTVRWTVDDFLTLAEQGLDVNSDIFRFASVSFYLSIDTIREFFYFNATSVGQISLIGPLGGRLPGPFSYQLSTEYLPAGSSSVRIFQGPVRVQRSNFYYCRLKLCEGGLWDIRKALNPDGSLVLLCKLRLIPEEPADAPAPPLLHRAEGLIKLPSLPSRSPRVKKMPRSPRVKKMPTPGVNKQRAADGAGRRGLFRPVEGEPNVKVLAGSLQQDLLCTKNTWIVPNFRPRLEYGTLHVYSEKFPFGSRLWQLRLSPSSGQRESDVVGDSELLLSLEEVDAGVTSYPFTWKLSTEDGAGAILRSSGGMCGDANGARDLTLPLGPLRDVRLFLDSEGALRATCELRLLQETADASSQAESGVGADVLARDLERLLSSGDASDATVRVKGQKDFRVHRNILGARTPVFSSMFRHQMSENATGVVDIEDCEPDTFGQFLHYVYTGRVEDLRPENAIPLYQVADKYQVEELKLECLEHIRGGLGVESFCPTLTLALTYSEKELTRLATDFFVDHAKEITLTVGWQRFLCENPIQANELIVRMLQNTQEKTTSTKKLNR